LAQSPKSEKVKYVNVIQKCVPVKRTAIGSKRGTVRLDVLKESDVLGEIKGVYLFMRVKL
jgi:hypothetical protein